MRNSRICSRRKSLLACPDNPQCVASSSNSSYRFAIARRCASSSASVIRIHRRLQPLPSFSRTPVSTNRFAGFSLIEPGRDARVCAPARSSATFPGVTSSNKRVPAVETSSATSLTTGFDPDLARIDVPFLNNTLVNAPPRNTASTASISSPVATAPPCERPSSSAASTTLLKPWPPQPPRISGDSLWHLT